MRLKVISCNVFLREVCLVASRAKAVLDISFIRQGLHSYPDFLRQEIQAAVDTAETEPDEPLALSEPPEEYAAIVLVFGLCSRALCGIRSRRFPLVLPRAHDCIGILLGSHRRYREEFDAHPGTYWFSPGWVEQSLFPCGPGREQIRQRYAARYGADNADYLVEHKYTSLRGYSRAALITWPELDRPEYHEHAVRAAGELGWQCDRVEGSSGLLERILNGEWHEEDAAVAAPGETFELGDDNGVVKVMPWQT